MDCFNTETIACENYEYLKQDEERINHGHRYSGKALNVSSKIRKCVFCDSDKHYSGRRNIVTDIEKRNELLKSNRLCFNCLKGGHQRKNFKVKINVFNVKKKGVITLPYVILVMVTT